MYLPKQFAETSLDEVSAFIKAHSFATLVSWVEGRPWATHIPLELYIHNDGRKVLEGHISKGNKQAAELDQNKQVLAIFQGPHAYISSTWYNHENVPTWNYQVVHIYGIIHILSGNELHNSLSRLMDTYEDMRKTYLKIEDLSESTVKREMKGIVGFELEIQEIQAAFKLSQNRDDESYKNIVTQLEQSEKPLDREMATIMKGKRKSIF